MEKIRIFIMKICRVSIAEFIGLFIEQACIYEKEILSITDFAFEPLHWTSVHMWYIL